MPWMDEWYSVKLVCRVVCTHVGAHSSQSKNARLLKLGPSGALHIVHVLTYNIKIHANEIHAKAKHTYFLIGHKLRSC